MLVTALCTACFSWAKINKKLWPPTLRFGPPSLNALAPALALPISRLTAPISLCIANAEIYFISYVFLVWGGGSSADIFRTRGQEFARFGRSIFLLQNIYIFRKLWCIGTDKESGSRQCGHFSDNGVNFFVILCRLLLWTVFAIFLKS